VIVVGTDGSDHAADAVEAGAELAAASDATVEVVAAHRLLLPDRAELGDVVRDAAEAHGDLDADC
jgi:nucleotide-binding universal stress UspA family protein